MQTQMQMFNVLLKNDEDKDVGGKAPVRGSRDGAGYDLFSPVDGVINPLSRVKIGLGIRVEFSPGWVGLIQDRSSWGIKGVIRLAGVIDADYRKEWAVILYNSSHEEVQFKAGDKIAQVVFIEHATIEPTIVSSLGHSERVGGFGSTGR